MYIANLYTLYVYINPASCGELSGFSNVIILA